MPTLTLTLLPFNQVATVRAAPAATAVAPAAAAAQQPAAANTNANAAASANASAAPATFPSDNADDAAGAADGFLINGSMNNGAASPFAQARAFGNNRPGGRALYTGGIGLLSSHSALDADPYSFSSRSTQKPNYNDVQFVANIGGPLRLPRVRNDPNAFLGYQHIEDHGTTMQSGLVPTVAERAGDFSQSRNLFGQPVQLIDPATGQPFASNRIPGGRLSPAALSLLGYYPLPNAPLANGFNYQLPIVVGTQQDSLQGRLSQVVNPRQQLVGSVAYQRTATETSNLFNFVDKATVANTNASLVWTNRLSQFTFMRARYEFTNLATDVTPHFANLVNVSGVAGIMGNDQDPTNWGPPALSFTSGLAGLATGNYARNDNRTHGGTAGTLPQPRPPQRHHRRRHPRRLVPRAVPAEPARRIHLHGSVQWLRRRRLPAGPAAVEHDCVRQRRQAPSSAPRRGLRQRRLARVVLADREPRPAVGVRVADDRSAEPPGQPGRGGGLPRRAAGDRRQRRRAR